ncbi:Uncharacterized protein APZ42_027277 [Daphnia magna]|uniref:Uncharacterized protein n=1 Tax=Daphnia magna TaxID=35525 RepID=A0A164RE83_9CRUS|nr:Uncharacterized protein APZ42_027277 [Daphnia magna]
MILCTVFRSDNKQFFYSFALQQSNGHISCVKQLFIAVVAVINQSQLVSLATARYSILPYSTRRDNAPLSLSCYAYPTSRH